jgi:hypothetical protein
MENSSLKRLEIIKPHSKSAPLLELIQPRFLDIDPNGQIVIILSYDTTEKTSFLITAFHLTDKHTLWQLKQSDFDKSDYVKNNSTLNIFIKHDNDFIFNSGGLLIRADANTGKIKWSKQQ